MKILISTTNPSLGVAFAASLLKVPFEWNASISESLLELEDETSLKWPPSIGRYLARKFTIPNLYGESIIHKTEVDHWLTFSFGSLTCKEEFSESIEYLDRLLGPVTYLVNNVISLADLFIFETLYKNPKWQTLYEKKEAPKNISRWYKHLLNLDPFSKVLSIIKKPSSPQNVSSIKQTTRKEEGKFIELEGAEMGKVVVRFPPEASGYLHIGHAKAALLNQYYKDAFKGKLVFRFDDTNPAKEKVDFEKVILEDIALLGLTPDRYTHTSDYFDLMLSYCEKLLKEGKAYVDDTDPETMKTQREQRIKSEAWNNSIDRNLELWCEMVKGTELGQRCCVRARIDMNSVNGCLRDPTIYRCKPEPHPKTGNKYKVYPTYDFACPIVDSIEDVTHCLRTTEYHDRDEQFFWFIEALGLRKPHIWEYSRLNMTHTVLSKRKLTWFVEEGIVEGWDDPRMPTVRGILRRGMTVEGLRDFIVAQGSSRSVVVMEWDKIWAFNKKVIDPIAPRFTALLNQDLVVVNVKGAEEKESKAAKHPKNPEVGEKTVWQGPRVLVDQADAQLFQPGENVTFINWGNLLIEQVTRDSTGKVKSVDAKTNFSNTDFKKTLKVTWLADTQKATNTPCICIYLDHLITKPVLGKDEDFKKYMAKETKTIHPMIGDPELANLKKSDIIQLQRRGFFICDKEYKEPSIYSGVETPCVLIYVPDGHSKQPTLNLESEKEKARSQLGKTAEKSPQEEQWLPLASRVASQADHVRHLKANKADKTEIDAAVQTLLKLKAEYKSETGQEWKSIPPQTPTVDGEKLGVELNQKIIEQGDKVRQLKSNKAEKAFIDSEVKVLLELKAEFKKASGIDWKPGVQVPLSSPVTIQSPPKLSAFGDGLNEKIIQQGDKVRKLKAEKADKSSIDAEVKILLQLKGEYKLITGQDWKPGVLPQSQGIQSSENHLFDLVENQGNKVRQLKTDKADKFTIDSEVQKLLALKRDYKEATGQEWRPKIIPQQSQKPSGADLNNKIIQQGDKVRQLKTQKAEKNIIDQEVNILLSLKSEYKTATSQDWKPVGVTPQQQISAGELNEKIKIQGDKVRQLKSNKAEKSTIDAEVKTLLELKTQYKQATGQDWKPGALAEQQQQQQVQGSSAGSDLSDKITKQGDKVRQLKANKAEKSEIDSEVKTLLALKAEFKTVTGQDWKPPVVSPSKKEMDSKAELASAIQTQGDHIRQLKGSKANKVDIDEAVKSLLSLKAKYKSVTGEEWKPPSATPGNNSDGDNKVTLLSARITEQGNIVRELKSKKPPAEKSKIDTEVNQLLKLKAEFKALTNKDWSPEGGGARRNKKDEKSTNNNPPASTPKNINSPSASVKKQTRLGLEAKKEENLPDWYSQVLTKGELIEYYDVSGCYILRPWAFSIWETIRDFFDREIKKLGVQNCYFPMFVPKSALEREKQHIADFSPEVAWVTQSGDSTLAEPIAIRPTSETGMYPAFAKWIQSHRDLPIRLNQWNNVVRWEFKHPQPFLRTREFLWQEGHTAWAKQPEAEEEVLTILDLYERVYTELLAIPVIKGRKTEKEKFAGGYYTTTTEAFIAASGRGIQGATSHHLGQNFSKMFDITFEDPETQEKQYAFQNSWGMTTRVIGVMIMVHADNQGLVLPPNVATLQVIIIPCGLTASLSEDTRKEILEACENLEKAMKSLDIRVKSDLRDNYSPGWKFNHWELKGVPLRVEVGPKDLENNQFVAIRRDIGKKLVIPNKDINQISKILEEIQESLLQKATKELETHLIVCKKWTDFCTELDHKNIILSPFCERIECEELIKKESAKDEGADPGAPSMGAKSLCIPFKQPSKIESDDKCIHPSCQEKPRSYTLFGRSY